MSVSLRRGLERLTGSVNDVSFGNGVENVAAIKFSDLQTSGYREGSLICLDSISRGIYAPEK